MDVRVQVIGYLRHRSKHHGPDSAQAEFARRVLAKLRRPAYHGAAGLLDALVEANSPTDEGTVAHPAAMAAECMAIEAIIDFLDHHGPGHMCPTP